MDLDLSDQELVASARRWLASLTDGVLADFRGVVRSSPGYFPTTLFALWSQEVARRSLVVPPQDPQEASGPLPVGHPQDCDWRFLPPSASALLNVATEGLAAGDGIVHLGAHSTFSLAVRVRPDLTHLLLDRNRSLIDALAPGLPEPHAAACVDLAIASVGRGAMGAAILDPPWYPRDTVIFLQAATRCCAPGARLILCQPTLATRPGVQAERDELRRQAAAMGLEVTQLLPSFIRYETPHFEAMSLRATLGGFPIPRDWRTGDVMILTKRQDVDCAPASAPAAEQEWAEVRFGPVRIKLRQSAPGNTDLASVVEGDRLTTVSRRDAARPRIGLWTSGNRVYGVSDPDTLAAVITCCGRDLVNLRFTYARTMAHCEAHCLPASTGVRLFDLLVLELQEHWLMGGGT